MLDKKEVKQTFDKTALAEIPKKKKPTNALKIIVAAIVGIGVGWECFLKVAQPHLKTLREI